MTPCCQNEAFLSSSHGDKKFQRRLIIRRCCSNECSFAPLFHEDFFFLSLSLQDELNWALQIARVGPDDAGQYECQATTHPPQSILVQLKVVGEFVSAVYIRIRR